MSDSHADRENPHFPDRQTGGLSVPQNWNCSHCNYQGRVRTRLEKGMTRLDWGIISALLAAAAGLVFFEESWALGTEIGLIVIVAVFFFMVQFRPARTVLICPQCRKKSRLARDRNSPMIPVSRRSRRRGSRSKARV